MSSTCPVLARQLTKAKEQIAAKNREAAAVVTLNTQTVVEEEQTNEDYGAVFVEDDD